MKSKFAKARSMAGLFLEALMLVFLFAYAQADFAPEQSETAEGEPLSGIVLSCAIAVPSSSVSQAFHSTPQQIPATEQVILPGLPGICVALSRALYISRFERDTFYIASADAIP